MKKVKQMKLLLITVLFALTSVLLSSCYPDYGLTVQDFDIVYTVRDNAADFQIYRTYTLPDSVLKIGSGGILEPNNGTNDALIISELNKQMQAYGYTLSADSASSDLSIYVGVTSSTTVTYYPGWWGGYYGWYYPYYGYGGYSYSYTTGSLFITMIDNAKFNAQEQKIGSVWNAAMNGVLDSTTPAELRTRIVNGIDKMFAQSPYLKIYE